MTLNDNPRVDAEKRVKQLYNRLYLISGYTSHEVEYNGEGGMATRLYPNPRRANGSRLCQIILKEIRIKEKFLKTFK